MKRDRSSYSKTAVRKRSQRCFVSAPSIPLAKRATHKLLLLLAAKSPYKPHIEKTFLLGLRNNIRVFTYSAVYSLPLMPPYPRHKMFQALKIKATTSPVHALRALSRLSFSTSAARSIQSDLVGLRISSPSTTENNTRSASCEDSKLKCPQNRDGDAIDSSTRTTAGHADHYRYHTRL